MGARRTLVWWGVLMEGWQAPGGGCGGGGLWRSVVDGLRYPVVVGQGVMRRGAGVRLCGGAVLVRCGSFVALTVGVEAVGGGGEGVAGMVAGSLRCAAGEAGGRLRFGGVRVVRGRVLVPGGGRGDADRLALGEGVGLGGVLVLAALAAAEQAAAGGLLLGNEFVVREVLDGSLVADLGDFTLGEPRRQHREAVVVAAHMSP
ncbi:hypothetical protein IU501_12325 [Nocardia otitidiscaviarum]|uniref:hypothetical protein n=1 Tax=Nocardia otitidiscaviarum TaxID=1823 RepID=UPI000A64B339|nr:hypothetical protein [Nocardia otitidiscaviarum]MBF6133784.1 hypothetical protein [Nocardia otitidiscaviarum]MBF6487812.1 hypothetical protein [Nocardia otitidiscaviarum]